MICVWAACLVLLLPAAAHADYITRTSTGTLSGVDPGNVFGTGNTSLDTVPYALVLIFDPTVPAKVTGIPFADDFAGFSFEGGPLNGYGYDMWAKLTVAGNDFLLQGDDSTYGSYYPVRPYYQLYDIDVGGHVFSLTMNYLEFDFSVYGVIPNFSELASASFYAETFEQTINPGSYTPSVPEPHVWAMMVIGFGAIGCSLRHRNLRRVPKRAFPWVRA
jgi:hypothetical protein